MSYSLVLVMIWFLILPSIQQILSNPEAIYYDYVSREKVSTVLSIILAVRIAQMCYGAI
jgi:hypothetical protein